MPDRKLSDTGEDRAVKFLEAAAPWIMVGLITLMVLVALLTAVLGAPWTR